MTDDQKTALPIPDYDHLNLGALEARVHSLVPAELEQLLAFERDHAARLPVLTVLERRLDAVRAGAAVSDRSAGGEPARVEAPGGGSRVSPATSGPPINPPSQGDPTNPAQPR